MSEPLVLGAVLRVDVVGWEGPPPPLPSGPIRVEERSGARSFYYDLLPRRSCIPVAEACERVGVAIERALPDWPFGELAFPPRCRLDFGLVVEGAGPWRVDWSSPFLAVLAEAEFEFGTSFYPSVAGEREGGPGADLITPP